VAFGEPVARERQELAKLLREVVRTLPVAGATQYRGRHGIGSRGTPYAEVDAPWVQRLQHPEGLDDPQWSVVGKHDPTCTDSDAGGLTRHVPNHHLWRGAGDAGQVVVLGEPVSLVSEPVGEPGQSECIVKGPGAVRARADRREVEDG
jgi:hypothetical protein